MGQRYLLPCSCGQKIVIESRQAGEIAVCPCGTSLQVPTMLGMAALEPAPSEEVALPRAAWGWPQRIRLLGVVLAALAAVAAIGLLLNRPISPFQMIQPEQIQASAKDLTPLGTWNTWEQMRQGLDRRTDQKYEAAVVSFRAWLTVAFLMGATGVGLTVAGAMMRKRRPALA